MRRAIVGIVVGALAAVGLAACSSSPSGGYVMTAYFDKAISLYPQSSVKVLGLPAGRVTSVSVVGTKVRVRMRIDKNIPVPANVNATIVPLSLIGERYVQLFPAWTNGTPRAKDGAVIPAQRTSIPVEPDEALAAVKHLLDTLDPHATGRLVKNLGEDLNGTGPDLNGALKGLGDLTQALADKDQQLVDIIDHFDQFTATLATREAALGKVMNGFAQTTGLLADERTAIEGLVHGLASVSTSGLDLTSEHAVKLDHDLTVLTRTLQSVNVNIDAVRNLLDATPLLVAGQKLDGTTGLAGAWDPTNHRIDLRNSVSPQVAQLFQILGLQPNIVCLPADVDCQLPPDVTTTTAPPSSSAQSQQPAASPGNDHAPAAPTWLKKMAHSLAEVFS